MLLHCFASHVYRAVAPFFAALPLIILTASIFFFVLTFPLTALAASIFFCVSLRRDAIYAQHERLKLIQQLELIQRKP